MDYYLIMKFLYLIFILLVVISASTNNASTNSASTNSALSAKEFVWRSIKRHKNDITVYFSCNKNQELSIALTDPGQPNFIINQPDFKTQEEGWQAVVRIWTGNVPSSGEGYKKFIYASAFLKDEKKLFIKKREVQHFIKELEVLGLQTFTNEQKAIAEYEEKIKHCDRISKSQRQMCYASSSGYQPQKPYIALYILAEETHRPKWRFDTQFDPKELKNLKKLSCYQN